MKRRAAAILALLSGMAWGGPLPVFLADNHAESFGWIARTFDLEEPMELVLVDAHADATSAARSDELREQVRRVASAEERNRRVESWRAAGRLQAFNWIEPLMPRPLERVLWVRPVAMDDGGRDRARRDMEEYLDGRLEFEPRAAGSLVGRCEVTDVAGLRDWRPGIHPVVLAVDLDFFSGMADAGVRFEEIWETAMKWPGLRGVAFAVSRPWLANDQEADRLVAMAVDAVRRTRGALLECDLTIDGRPDASLRHGEITRSGGVVPRWDVARASAGLRVMLGCAPAGWRATDRKRKAEDLNLTGIKAGLIQVEGAAPGCDGAVRPAKAGGVLRVVSGDGVEATGRVRWYARKSALAAYDLMPQTGLGRNFAANPGRWIYERRAPIAETTDGALTAEAWRKLLDGPGSCGRVVVEADYETTEGWLPVLPVDLRVAGGTGFHGALGECFGMPYVFGVALEADSGGWGVDTGWGGDCSNFLAYAWRRSGVAAPWGDPGRLRGALETVPDQAGVASGVKLAPGMVERGVMVDFGRHVAAVWEDRDPVGTLDGGDLLVHHLGGRPEVVTMAALAAERPRFAVRVAPTAGACTLGIAGDVVLAGEPAGADDLARSLAGVDLAMANLEGIPSARDPERPVVEDFRFGPERVEILRRAGVRIVSLANNHAADAGLAGLLEGRAAVEKSGIAVVGAGRDLAAALQPWTGEVKGVKLAVFGACVVEAPAAGADSPGVLKLPEHAAALESALAAARRGGAWPVVIIHWGNAHSATPDDDQRHWARWLAERGVRVVAGAGPHVEQPVEGCAGAAIAYSLGNAVYPKHLLGRGNGRCWIIRIGKTGTVGF